MSFLSILEVNAGPPALICQLLRCQPGSTPVRQAALPNWWGERHITLGGRRLTQEAPPDGSTAEQQAFSLLWRAMRRDGASSACAWGGAGMNDATVTFCSSARPPDSGMGPFWSIAEARAGRKTLLHSALFRGSPRSPTGTHGRHYTMPYEHDPSGEAWPLALIWWLPWCPQEALRHADWCSAFSFPLGVRPAFINSAILYPAQHQRNRALSTEWLVLSIPRREVTMGCGFDPSCSS